MPSKISLKYLFSLGIINDKAPERVFLTLYENYKSSIKKIQKGDKHNFDLYCLVISFLNDQHS